MSGAGQRTPAQHDQKSFCYRFSTHLQVGFILRVALVLYANYQDNTMLVKYTDIDYRVFTDASRHILEDGSPYDRHTYRYTPLLAWMLLPNVILTSLFGKFLFSAFDVTAAYLIYVHVKGGLFPAADDYCLEKWARRAAFMWLYNPMVMAVSSRGSAESIIITLVLATALLYQQRVYGLAGMALGVSIHFKLYPIIFTLPMYMALYEGHPSTAPNWFLKLFQVNRARRQLVLFTVATLSLLTWICYGMYGWEFVEETYLHHVTRRDTRHNFSVYFYMLYLTYKDDDLGISVLSFLPQVVLLLAIIKQFAERPSDIPFCLFAQTLVFVTYNKVVTSQYFLWYLCLLPLVYTKLRLTNWEAVTMLLLWGFTQASWLLPAYFLEFKGYNTFQFIWIESLAFFAGNVGILSKFVRKYREHQARLVREQAVVKRMHVE